MKMNKLTVKNQELGTYEITLSDEQLEKVLKAGADVVEKEMDFSEGWYLPEGIGTVDTEDGFTNSGVNWDQYFGVSRAEILNAVKQATAYEGQAKVLTNTILKIAMIGLITYGTGGAVPAAGIIGTELINIAGTLVKKP